MIQLQGKIQAIRGMQDVVPSTNHILHHIEALLRRLTHNYGYEEIRFPILEKTELFKRTIGEVTDIVEKEMYTFEDRNGDSLTLRPEGTASTVRLGLEQGLFHNQTQRLWYLGPMFRHERPQKGRYRQFYQFGLEAIGFEGPDIDLEVLAFCARLWKELGVQDKVRLQTNSLGTKESRLKHKTALVAYLQQFESQLDEDSQRRLSTNPLRILDSKDPNTQNLVKDAPKLIDYLEDDCKNHFEKLCQGLKALDIPFEINPCLVRGLDYYTRTVFEWVTTELGAQGTVCAGGHYDGLIEQLGGQSMPAIGFSLGMERLALLLETLQDSEQWRKKTTVYVISGTDAARTKALVLAEELRALNPSIRIESYCGEGSFKSQFKRADKSNAEIALVIGEDELAKEQVTVKYLREDKPQETLGIAQLHDMLKVGA